MLFKIYLLHGMEVLWLILAIIGLPIFFICFIAYQVYRDKKEKRERRRKQAD